MKEIDQSTLYVCSTKDQLSAEGYVHIIYNTGRANTSNILLENRDTEKAALVLAGKFETISTSPSPVLSVARGIRSSL